MNRSINDSDTDGLDTPVRAYLVEDSIYEALTRDASSKFFQWALPSGECRIRGWNEEDMISGRVFRHWIRLVQENIQPVLVLEMSGSHSEEWIQVYHSIPDKTTMPLLLADTEQLESLRYELRLMDSGVASAWGIFLLHRTEGVHSYEDCLSMEFWEAYRNSLTAFCSDKECVDLFCEEFPFHKPSRRKLGEEDEYEWVQKPDGGKSLMVRNLPFCAVSSIAGSDELRCEGFFALPDVQPWAKEKFRSFVK